jgi:hypothetical protein
MKRKYFIPSVLVVAGLFSACAPKVENNFENQVVISKSHATPVTKMTHTEYSDPAACPVTVAQEPPFVPPAPYEQPGSESEFWYGSHSLWTAVRRNGTWNALPRNPDGYTQKVFWWREGDAISEKTEPALTVTAERLDGNAPMVTASKATNASAGDIGSAMLVGMDLPTLGCWKITGRYGDEKLIFIVWVAP